MAGGEGQPLTRLPLIGSWTNGVALYSVKMSVVTLFETVFSMAADGNERGLPACHVWHLSSHTLPAPPACPVPTLACNCLLLCPLHLQIYSPSLELRSGPVSPSQPQQYSIAEGSVPSALWPPHSYACTKHF